MVESLSSVFVVGQGGGESELCVCCLCLDKVVESLSSVFVVGQGGGESELCEGQQFPAACDG